jgi:hypothetical protein
MRIRIWQLVTLAIVSGTALPIALHHALHGGWNLHQMALAYFLWLNAIIAFWEICLFLRIGAIETDYRRFKEEYRGRELARVKDFMLKPIRLSEALSPATWGELWSSYAIFDESYASKTSFGFFVDVGNGFTTAIPTLLFLYGMSWPILPARILGILGLLLFYQMWYGTLVYFGSYLLNRRFQGHDPRNVALFVGASNGMWFVFPIWGMGVAIELITSNSFAILGH